MKQLIYAPMAHSEVYQGVAQRSKAYGGLLKDEMTRMSDKFWVRFQEVAPLIARPGIRVYFEGQIEPTVKVNPWNPKRKDLPQFNSHEDLITWGLLLKGGWMQHTENESLLEEHKRVYIRLLDAHYEKYRAQNKGGLSRLLGRGKTRDIDAVVQAVSEQEQQIRISRDSYIAQQINETLNDGETGILLLGSAHRAHTLLDPSIELRLADREMYITLQEITEKFKLGPLLDLHSHIPFANFEGRPSQRERR